MKKHVVIVAGGTGGHIYPAIVFAQTWRAQGHHVSWIGTQEGLEASIVPKYNFSLYFIQVKGLRRTGKIKQFFALWGAVRAFFQALFLLKKLKPNVVLAMGGYVSGPVALAAKCLSIPIVLHEQNAIAGKTNQIIVRFAKKVLTAFPNVLTHYQPIVCGNPVRKDLFSLNPKPCAHSPMNILILGGSRGALSLNKMLPEMLMQIPNVAIWHQTGEKHFEETKRIYEENNRKNNNNDEERSVLREGIFEGSVDQRRYGTLVHGCTFPRNALSENVVPNTKNSKNICITPYINNMQEAYNWTDIVICRAGAMTVFEIMTVGRPAIFIPYPYAVDDHQTANAKSLVDRSAALLLQERDLTLESLQKYIDALREQLNYQRYANNAFHGRMLDTDKIVVNTCLEVAK